ncbi:MAG: SUMF1/EgtB/PvdO family nonheme iron enzyme, partial [Gallionellaceae bacterium]
TLTCKKCDASDVVDKLKELSALVAPAAPVVASAPANLTPEPASSAVKGTDPESITWNEAQKGNTIDDYQVYLDSYPKGKYIAFAKAKIKKLKEAAQVVQEQQEQSAWDTAQQENSEASFNRYLQSYPNGRFAGFANARLGKLKKEEADLEAKQRREQLAEEARQKREQAEASKNAGKGPAMVRIPGKNYEMGKYHVTRGEFAKFVSETGYDAGNECYVFTDKWEKKTGYNWRNPNFSQDDNHPVTCVNWNDAQAYVSWLARKTGKQYRLPTEAEWEYACYGGSQTEYCGSNDINAVAWYKENSNSATHPVGQKQANGYGLYDMSGNLWQWMENKYDDKNDWRALRGGSWSYEPQYVRAASRGSDEPTGRSDDSGFRLARTLP